MNSLFSYSLTLTECCVKHVPYECLGQCFQQCKRFSDVEMNHSNDYGDNSECSKFSEIMTHCCESK